MIAAGAGPATTRPRVAIFPQCQAVRIDTQPRGLWQGLRTADLRPCRRQGPADAIVSRLQEKGINRRGWRSNEIAAKIATTADNPDPKPYTPPGTSTAASRQGVGRGSARIGTSSSPVPLLQLAMTHRAAAPPVSHPDRFRRDRLRSTGGDRRRGAQQRQGR